MSTSVNTQTGTACKYCTAETTNGLALCGRCQRTADTALANIAAAYADLALIPLERGLRRGSSTPDPTGIAAAHIVVDPVTEADDAATNTLTTWARCLVLDRPQVGRPPRTVNDLAPWLAKHTITIATLPWAGDYLHGILRTERHLRKVASRADTGSYVGVCGNEITASRRHDETSCWCACHLGGDECEPEYGPDGCGREYGEITAETCTEPLYAPRAAALVRCRCGANWDVRARRQALVRQAEDELAPVAVIAHLAAVFSGEASVGTLEARIRQWAKREEIRHVTTKVIDGRPRKVYRVGDVLDMLAARKRTA